MPRRPRSACIFKVPVLQRMFGGACSRIGRLWDHQVTFPRRLRLERSAQEEQDAAVGRSARLSTTTGSWNLGTRLAITLGMKTSAQFEKNFPRLKPRLNDFFSLG